MQNNYKDLLKKRIRHSLYGMLMSCLLVASVFALDQQQGITVSGKVIAADDGASLPGVSIVLKGTMQGTTTDAEGKYTIQVPDGNATLVFSFIGYTAQEIAVN